MDRPWALFGLRLEAGALSNGPTMDESQGLHKKRILLAVATMIAAVAMAGILVFVWVEHDLDAASVLSTWFMFFVGVGAATIANSTGVGGGVVFLPAFEFLSRMGIHIAAAQIVGMSFIIQCFGMSTGSLTWLNRIYRETDAKTGKSPRTGVPEGAFWRIILTVLAVNIPVMLLVQRHYTAAPENVLFWFKLFSIALGLTLLLTTLFADIREHRRMTRFDYAALALLSIPGGIATAFFSVGIGELIALYLFIRNFPLVTSAASAVIVSAVSVLAGAPWHLDNTDLPWRILILVIPGAILGGWLARRIAYSLGAKRLKILASLWIIGSSLWLIIR